MGYNGDQVARLRKGMKLSRRKLGLMIEVSQKTIARWEHGEVEPALVVLFGIQFLKDSGVESRKDLLRSVVRKAKRGAGGQEETPDAGPAALPRHVPTDEELDAVWDV